MKLAEVLQDARDVVVVYTDLAAFSIWEGTEEDTLEWHAQQLVYAAGNRTVMVPTYNYDWCQTGRYDPARTPTVVGALNEHLRQTRGKWRSVTPVFTFSALGFKPPHYPPRQAVRDPFGPGSVLRWLVDIDATVLCYGCDLRYASACHVNERDRKVPYRFFKEFPGEVAGYGPLTLDYHVRPQGDEVEYDWAKLNGALEGVFTRHDIGYGEVAVSTAGSIYRLISELLAADEHWLLTQVPTELYERCGRPLKAGCFE